MRVIKYSIICEDSAHRLFIENLLKHHFEKSVVKFEFDFAFFKRFKCRNNHDVLNSYVIQIERSSFLNPYNLDVVFVGIDYDSRPRQNFRKELEQLYERLSTSAEEKAFIFFPVQAIEHWFLFIKRKNEMPSLTKNIAGEIERIQRKEAKQYLYERTDMTKEEKEKLLIKLIANADLDWLSQQSESFSLFYQRLQKRLLK